MTERFYHAQCVKNDTTAESIVRAQSDAGAPLVIQWNGDFDSDLGEGTVARVERRLSSAKVLVISAIPVASLDSIPTKPLRIHANWLLFTRRRKL